MTCFVSIEFLLSINMSDHYCFRNVLVVYLFLSKINTSQPYTLEEVGGMFNLSRERVRQIQTKAMRKLRRPQVARRLKGWLH